MPATEQTHLDTYSVFPMALSAPARPMSYVACAFRAQTHVTIGTISHHEIFTLNHSAPILVQWGNLQQIVSCASSLVGIACTDRLRIAEGVNHE